MPDNALPAPTVDLAGLIPAQRVAEPEITPTPETSDPVTAPERLALLWTFVGAVAGSAVVALALLVLLTLLP